MGEAALTGISIENSEDSTGDLEDVASVDAIDVRKSASADISLGHDSDAVALDALTIAASSGADVTIENAVGTLGAVSISDDATVDAEGATGGASIDIRGAASTGVSITNSNISGTTVQTVQTVQFKGPQTISVSGSDGATVKLGAYSHPNEDVSATTDIAGLETITVENSVDAAITIFARASNGGASHEAMIEGLTEHLGERV